jgi:hypothetical protein
MTKPMVRIHNVETDEVFDREMNDVEFDQYEADQAIESARRAAEEAKETQRQAILDRLGLTSDEARLLLGS